MKKAILFALVCVCCFATAQEAVQPAGPPAELKKLSFMVGDWTGSFAMSMGGQDMKMDCVVKAEWVHKGNFLRTTMSVDMQGTKSEGVSYTGYDAKEKTYKSYGFEDMSPQVREESGTFDGTKLVMTSKPWEAMGQPATFRSTFQMKGDDLYMLLEMKQGDDWVKFGDCTFKKKAVTTPVEK